MKHLKMYGQDKSVCGHNGELTEDWQEARHCKSCVKTDAFKMTKQLWKEENDHPKLRRALKDKIDMKLEVTPDESKRVQEICFSEGVYWKIKDTSFRTCSKFLFVGYFSNYSICQDTAEDREYFENYNSDLFSFKDDCFVDEIEQDLSDCGRNLDEFLKSIIINITSRTWNIEKYEKSINKWLTMYYIKDINNIESLKFDINVIGLKNYRIKEPMPSVEQQQADGWNGKTIKEASFEPKQYTITEDQLNELIKEVYDGIDCFMTFRKNHQEMKDMAFDMKTIALNQIAKMLKKIKGI